MEDDMPRHHIIPRSRCKDCGVKNPDIQWNITEVPEREHNLYHALFTNKTPSEIIAYLLENFWGGNPRILRYQSESNIKRLEDVPR
jgi:hypothetical protein